MIGLIAVINIKPGKEKQVSDALLKMAAAVNKLEEECLLYEPYLPQDGASKIYILEKYTSLDALDQHRRTEHYRELRQAIDDAVEGPTELTLLEPIQ